MEQEGSYQRGLQLYAKGEFEAAAQKLRDALAEQETSERWNDWATVQVACNHPAEAEGGYLRALELDPQNGQAAANLGALLASLQRSDEACPLLERGATSVDEQQRGILLRLLAECREEQTDRSARGEHLRQGRPNENAWAAACGSGGGTTVPSHLGGHEGVTHLDEGVLDDLISTYQIRRMLDIGCGPGGMVKLARAKGLVAVGVDGDPRLPELSALPSQDFMLHDFTRGPLEIKQPFDLAWSVEFLEHVEERFQENYMRLFQQAKYVFCTAAPPGKPGHHHVNCRDQSYWTDVFRRYGFLYDPERSETLKAVSTMNREFVRETGMFFLRDDRTVQESSRAESPCALRLDFGCGEAPPRAGFVGVDIRPFPGVRYVCNAWEIAGYVAPSSVSAIYSRHFFEHLTFAQAEMTLRAWTKVLQPGGTLQIIVPDILYHIQQFLAPDRHAPSATNPQWTVRQHALAGFWGWQREGENKFWDVHKSGYDYALLEEALRRHGFQDIERLEDAAWNLNVKCRKGDLRVPEAERPMPAGNSVTPGETPHAALRKRQARVETVEEVFENIDEYMIQGGFEKRAWEVFELTQSQDASSWIADPALIEGLADNLKHLKETLKGMERPIKILDVGCYGGYLLDFLHRLAGFTPSDFCYKGIDVQPDAIEAARATHRESPGACFELGDVFSLKDSEKDKSYDAVWCARVLIHIPCFEKALQNLMYATRQKLLLVLKIAEQSSCKKILETDLETGKKVAYFFRIFSRSEVEKGASALELDYEILSGEPYSTVILCRKNLT